MYFSDVQQCSTAGFNLMFVYLLLGMLRMGAPLFICMGICFCMPCIICLLARLGRGSQQPAGETAIRKLEVKDYKAATFETKECGICLVDYEENDKVI